MVDATNTTTEKYAALGAQVDFWMHPYPPVPCEGQEVQHHDCPFFECGQLNCVCEYHVTKFDKPWNEYMKKSLTFTERGSFKSTYSRGGKKRWPKAIKQHDDEYFVKPPEESDDDSDDDTLSTFRDIPFFMNHERDFLRRQRERTLSDSDSKGSSVESITDKESASSSSSSSSSTATNEEETVETMSTATNGTDDETMSTATNDTDDETMWMTEEEEVSNNREKSIEYVYNY
ncbi:unnamed protein product [Rotaria sordida]|uniref:Uncharacterized protein n=1 Tax=Rotaria sordida TaxID=392033 RepID=A0A815YLN3_9BILA|nr:unnamed protein product [Rotaria sordida]CAF1572152.1 unnamed protein product [Rotaria sordida]